MFAQIRDMLTYEMLYFKILVSYDVPMLWIIMIFSSSSIHVFNTRCLSLYQSVYFCTIYCLKDSQEYFSWEKNEFFPSILVIQFLFNKMILQVEIVLLYIFLLIKIFWIYILILFVYHPDNTMSNFCTQIMVDNVLKELVANLILFHQ